MTDNAITGDDSPFSITGNVTGILTFLIAIIASFLAFVALARDSNSELDDYIDDVQRTLTQIVRIETVLFKPEASHTRGEELKALVASMEELLRTLHEHLSSGKLLANERKGTRNLLSRIFNFRRRAAWLFTRQQYLAGMNKMRLLKMEVLLAQNTYLMDEAIATKVELKLEMAKLADAINERN